ncbi:pentatricopeptide repeat-containing protein At4g21190 [Euphorbia lathyris]|uniref:pentatricopeptide repeat-containing protein At4g21190 n=1 Tax=Euphorbia lathyris TaxID=212925 RepID=UPI00331353C6
MFCLKLAPLLVPSRTEVKRFSSRSSVVLCALKGPRPRYPRVWKKKERIGTISKSTKLVECIKGLSNVKEEVYGALDSFVAWELEFPLIAVKKALKTLEKEQEWKRIIQVIKWMLSKGQGRTLGTYFTLLNALAEDERLEEAEELWTQLFSKNLEGMPRIFFDKMISIYYKRDMHDKMFEIFADMEELGVRPHVPIVNMMENVFQKLGMLDKYDKLKKKYPPPKWEYRYIKGKRIRVQAKNLYEAAAGADERAKGDPEVAGVNGGANNLREVAGGADEGEKSVHEVGGANEGANDLGVAAGADEGIKGVHELAACADEEIKGVHEVAGANGGANHVLEVAAGADERAKGVHEANGGVNDVGEVAAGADEGAKDVHQVSGADGVKRNE